MYSGIAFFSMLLSVLTISYPYQIYMDNDVPKFEFSRTKEIEVICYHNNKFNIQMKICEKTFII